MGRVSTPHETIERQFGGKAVFKSGYQCAAGETVMDRNTTAMRTPSRIASRRKHIPSMALTNIAGINLVSWF